MEEFLIIYIVFSLLVWMFYFLKTGFERYVDVGKIRVIDIFIHIMCIPAVVLTLIASVIVYFTIWLFSFKFWETTPFKR